MSADQVPAAAVVTTAAGSAEEVDAQTRRSLVLLQERFELVRLSGRESREY